MQPELFTRLRSSDMFSLVRTYGPEHITEDRKFLQVTLNQEAFQLKLVNVGGEEHPAYIAWLDTHPDHENVPKSLPHATAAERAHRIATLMSYYKQEYSTIITPASSKSIPSIEETVWMASRTLHTDLRLVILPGGKNEAEIADQSAIPPVVYQNITSGGKDKFLGITNDDLEFLQSAHHNGKKALFIDDVYTTGGTDIAMQMVVNRALHLHESVRHPLIVVATESEYGLQYPKKPPEHVFSIINLPEFVGGIPQVGTGRIK